MSSSSKITFSSSRTSLLRRLRSAVLFDTWWRKYCLRMGLKDQAELPSSCFCYHTNNHWIKKMQAQRSQISSCQSLILSSYQCISYYCYNFLRPVEYRATTTPCTNAFTTHKMHQRSIPSYLSCLPRHRSSHIQPHSSGSFGTRCGFGWSDLDQSQW